jgi:hypothetical protein
VVVYFWVFWQNPCMYFSFLPHMPHAVPISSSY